jgi:hypothetical protein
LNAWRRFSPQDGGTGGNNKLQQYAAEGGGCCNCVAAIRRRPRPSELTLHITLTPGVNVILSEFTICRHPNSTANRRLACNFKLQAVELSVAADLGLTCSLADTGRVAAMRQQQQCRTLFDTSCRPCVRRANKSGRKFLPQYAAEFFAEHSSARIPAAPAAIFPPARVFS